MKNLILKKIPDFVYARLKETARKKGTSIDQEAVELLTRFSSPTEEEVLAEIRDMRAWRKSLLKKGPLPTMDEIVKTVREGRQ
ncbi:MAG: hypothetical protein U0R19_10535 [Bryobacteraceae bacterium]